MDRRTRVGPEPRTMNPGWDIPDVKIKYTKSKIKPTDQADRLKICEYSKNIESIDLGEFLSVLESSAHLMSPTEIDQYLGYSACRMELKPTPPRSERIRKDSVLRTTLIV
ncbi:hypothetical protein JG688_00014987 [Phytophthora aleatoria]|uniref:Uncharacterized protein n=1 Tax=Phytophthora aleatoria TaxID=2496075 RepID=A0A8J5MD70_9STRA|nr:hypothetical protein JG688_00014987 [Phytophthora aleatoria]